MKRHQSTLFESWTRARRAEGTSQNCTSNNCDRDEIPSAMASGSSAQHRVASSSSSHEVITIDDEDEDEINEMLLRAMDICEVPESSASSSEPLEVLPGFDVDAGRSWVYPLNYPIRDYQFNITREALFKNTMVILPTGLGKTFIAAVVMYNFYRWYPQGKVVFMAPTRPLVAQQIEACHKIMGIPKDDSIEMTGTMSPQNRQIAWSEKRVFFLTPQVMVNDLSRGYCLSQMVKCIVIDEAHKALGNYAYCKVVRELMNYTNQFRVLALSATPGNDIGAVKQVLSNLLISHVELRTEESLDIQPYTHERKIEKIVVPLDEELSSIRSKFLDIIRAFLQRLQQRRVVNSTNPESFCKFRMLKMKEEMASNPPMHLSRTEFGVVQGDLFTCISLYHALELLQLHGMKPFYNFFQSADGMSRGNPRTRTILNQNPLFREIMSQLEEKFDGSSSETKKPFVAGHPKLKKLEEIILQHFRNCQTDALPDGGAVNTRVMIFSQYRDSVHEIEAMLQCHHPLVRVMSFIGQNTQGSKGFSQKKQIQVVQEFRQGRYNTLVSTCVGEEGLDIGEVDLIVCYDAQTSPIRLVQRMGRTGRKRQGRIVVLVTQGKEERMYQQSVYSKRRIHKVITKGIQSHQLYPNSPRMVPRGLNPACLKMYMTVESYQPTGKTRRTKSGQKGSKSKSPVSAEKLKEWKSHFRVSMDEAPKLKPTSFVTLPSHFQLRNQEVTEGPTLSLNSWRPWQSTLQQTYAFGHSSRTEIFVDVLQYMALQNQLGFESREVALISTRPSGSKDSATKAKIVVKDRGEDLEDFEGSSSSGDIRKKVTKKYQKLVHNRSASNIMNWLKKAKDDQDMDFDLGRGIVRENKEGQDIDDLMPIPQNACMAFKQWDRIKTPPPESELLPWDKEVLSPIDLGHVIGEEWAPKMEISDDEFPDVGSFIGKADLEESVMDESHQELFVEDVSALPGPLVQDGGNPRSEISKSVDFLVEPTELQEFESVPGASDLALKGHQDHLPSTRNIASPVLCKPAGQMAASTPKNPHRLSRSHQQMELPVSPVKSPPNPPEAKEQHLQSFELFNDSFDEVFQKNPALLEKSCVPVESQQSSTKYTVTQLVEMLGKPSQSIQQSNKERSDPAVKDQDKRLVASSVKDEASGLKGINFDLGFDLDGSSDEDIIPPSPPPDTQPPGQSKVGAKDTDCVNAKVSFEGKSGDDQKNSSSCKDAGKTLVAYVKPQPRSEEKESLPLQVEETFDSSSHWLKELTSWLSTDEVPVFDDGLQVPEQSTTGNNISKKESQDDDEDFVIRKKKLKRPKESSEAAPFSEDVDDLPKNVTKKPVDKSKTKRNKKLRKHSSGSHGGEMFLIKEADVSVTNDYEVSSDEEADTSLDTLDSSFIDDDEDCKKESGSKSDLEARNEDADTMALYLRSVKDVGPSNRFKLKFDYDRDVDVFSQQEDGNVGEEYEMDSFCVPNDDVEVLNDEDDEDPLDDSSVVDGKRMLRKRTWKRIVEVPSSSTSFEDETSPMKRATFSPGTTNQTLPIKCQNVFKQPGGSTSLLQSPISVQSPAKEVPNSSVFKKPSPCSKSVFSPAKSLSGSSIVMSTSANQSSLADMERQQRLERQRKKREEFLRKMQGRDASSQNAPVRTEETSSHIKADAAEKSKGNRSADEMMVAKTASNACQKKPVIFVDSREINGSQPVVSSLRRCSNIEVIVQQLVGVDYVVSSHVGVLRESVKDVANPQNRQKLLDRVQRLCELFDRPCLILEPERVKPGENPKQFHRSKYFNAVICYLTEMYIKVLYSLYQEMTAKILVDLAEQETQKGRIVQVPASIIPRIPTSMLAFYQSLPRVNCVCALNLAYGFTSIREFTLSSPKRIQDKGGMSAIRAQEIYRYLRSQFPFTQPFDSRGDAV